MIDTISGTGGAPNFTSKGGAASETSPKVSAPSAANVEGVSRQQEPDATRVSAAELVKKPANDVVTSHASDANLSIQRNDEVNRYVYRGVNPSTHEIQRQWPTEEALRQMTVFREMMGRVFDESS